jgi:site-specific DNA recombinase
VWKNQRKQESLIDVDDVALGHRTALTWNLKDVWVYADQPVHPALVRKHVTTLTDLSVGAAVHPAAD